ncbi:PAS domain S-box protein [Calothrix sp. FACHB-1219]|uniref:PAS domain S-box protein n=1 Tax=unclassified Calothrix TaxID=2619626 RepID=UPI0016830A7F|nr:MULTISPECIES: PAS domain S-box protein [unclassified Calothrix]MBD2203471.1 PAS domain S-box protein [Calothrix sp. FACHB-168]MBD2219063.1 PAS domain S-box protein [Calothrix sp. FACHB-1219]
MTQSSCLTILLIDDRTAEWMNFRQYLQQDSLYTYQILQLETATQAIAWCQQGKADVILLNFLLPDGNGLELLGKLRESCSNTQTAIILLTEHEDIEIAVRAMKNGAQDCLIQNQLTPATLHAAIHDAVKQRHRIWQLEQSREQKQLIAAIALRIRQSLQLKDILAVTSQQVRQFLQADRVVVYQFNSDMSGTVVSESVLPGWTVSLAQQIQDTCFQRGAGVEYRQGKTRAINNIYEAGLTDCHIQLLEQFEVKANLVVPILVRKRLWGLLIAHQCTAPRQWDALELELLDQLAVQIAIAIQQSTAYQITRTQLKERKRAQKTLQESVERFRSTFEQAAVGIAHVFLNGQFLRVNRRFCEITGYHQSELMNLTFQEITYPDDLPADLKQLQKLLLGAIDTYSMEKRYIRKDRTVIWIKLTVSLVHDAKHHPQYFISVIQDISQQKQAEAALEESEENFRQLAASVEEVFLIQNADFSKTIYLSPGYESIWQRPCEDVYKNPMVWLESVYPEDRNGLQKEMQRVMSGDKCQTEYRIFRPNGELRWILVQAFPVFDDDGKLYRTIASAQDITERKQAEIALQESEARFQAFMNNSPSASWITDADGRIVYLSRTYLRTFQVAAETVEDLIGRTVFDIYPVEIAQQFLDNIRLVAQTQEVLETEEKAPRTDGTLGDFLVYKFPLPQTSGQYLIGGVAVDITERILAEQALQKLNQELEERVKHRTAALQASEERWHLVLQGTNDGIWDWDIKNNQVFFSTRWKQMRGYSDDEISNQLEEWSSGIHPEDYDVVMQSLHDHFAQKTPFFQEEYRVKQKDGSYIWILDRGQALWDETGNVIRMSGSETDITERKQTQEKLHNLSDRLNLALAAGAIGTWDWDLVHEAEWDDRMYELYGMQRSEIPATYQDWQNAVYPDDLADVEAALQAAVRGEKEFNTEFRIVHPDGSIHFIRAAALVQPNEQGEPQRMVGINYDITERKRAEAQLYQINQELTQANIQLARATRLKDEFLANMSHELRTPLNAILGMSEAFQEGVLGEINYQQAKAIATIERSGRHLLELINEILDLAKIESGKLELQLSDSPVKSLCHSSLLFVQQLAFNKNLRLMTDIAESLGSMQADERRLRQVLINLLSNAIKFTPAGGVVTLKVWLEVAEGENSPSSVPHINFSVSDTGIGIASEDIHKLFQPFIQLDSSLNRQYDGTGLGLALVQRIIALHGGTVSVTSQVGEGSCFTVRIPYISSDRNSPTVPEVQSSNSGISSAIAVMPNTSALILLVEDNQANITTMANYLQHRGYRLAIANDGKQAIEQIYSQRPDIILMDIQMPEMDGIEAIKRIREDEQFNHIPIIALTALAMPSDRETCLAAGANEYLTKPVRLQHLIAKIQQLLT